MKTKKVLFIGEAVCLAHVIRPMSLALGLRQQYSDLEISFACGDAYRHLPESQGFEVHPLPTITTQDFFSRMYAGQPGYNIENLETYVEAEMDLIRKVKPDLVIGDMRLTLAVSCQLTKVPYVNILNAHWSPNYTLGFPVPDLPVTRFFGDLISKLVIPMVLPSVFKKQAEPYNQLCRNHGLAEMGSIKDVFSSGDHVLYADAPSLSPTEKLPSHHQYLGPILWEPEMEFPEAIKKHSSDQKQVYISMGSTGDESVVANTVSLCRSLGYKVVVTAKGDHHPWSDDPKVISSPMLPGLQVMKHCDLMICHGGSGTVYQALAQGVPVLAICANADQQLVMQGVEKQGAGLSMRAREASTSRIRDGVKSLVEKTKFREAALNAARTMRKFNANENFKNMVSEILGLAEKQESAPALKVAG